MANTFANFPAIIDPQPTGGQMHVLHDETMYTVRDVREEGAADPVYVWALLVSSDILSRAEIILSTFSDEALNPPLPDGSGRTILVYDVSQLTRRSSGVQYATREFTATSELFRIGLNPDETPFLTHVY